MFDGVKYVFKKVVKKILDFLNRKLKKILDNFRNSNLHETALNAGHWWKRNKNHKSLQKWSKYFIFTLKVSTEMLRSAGV